MSTPNAQRLKTISPELSCLLTMTLRWRVRKPTTSWRCTQRKSSRVSAGVDHRSSDEREFFSHDQDKDNDVCDDDDNMDDDDDQGTFC
ncbi:unnamed protein product [Cylicostephanus goldi]|uniref:Uncharacterized protein n=1 Tax=Cylicostephanus goldi TaxID=71465 RepID=A0A3P7Q149_CYLGO|nr:unnamed protein product [Cylicostephanus goldi]